VAILERIDIQAMVPERPVRSGNISWVSEERRHISGVPHIFFDDGVPWSSANAYALNKLHGAVGSDLKTVTSNMGHLKAYACWLEDQCIDWRYFPKRKKDRCLFRYRGFLIGQRQSGAVSPSTATARMAAIIQFYRWAEVNGWIDRKNMWEDRLVSIHSFSSIGVSRALSVQASELSIPNRKRPGSNLEDGFLPLSSENRDILLRYLRDEAKVELYLMYMIGCFTGARSETIRTLRLSSLLNAVDDSLAEGIKRVRVGPGTQVKTKFAVSGSLLFPKKLLAELERYAYSARRLTRQARASGENHTLLFLSERGNPYSETSFTKLISHLREKLIIAGYFQFRDFKFHQTRATFGTQLMRFAMDTLINPVDAIVFVRDAMLHKDEATTWKYVKFIENEPLKEALSNEFWNLFTGHPHIDTAVTDRVVDDALT
jgi:integrase